MSSGEDQIAREQWSLAQRRALVIAAGGIIAMLVGLAINPGHFFRAYLVAINFWLGNSLGCLVLLMLQYLTGGAWGMLLRRIFEAASRTLPLLFLLALPLALGLHDLYSWTDPHVVQSEPAVAHKSQYLDQTFFLARAGVYFLIWIATSFVLNRWSAQQDRTPTSNLRQPRRFRMFSAVGLVLYGLTITFASIDWIMSLEPTWYSTIFPPLMGAGQMLSGMAFAILVLVVLSSGDRLARLFNSSRRRDVGNLLLAFVMVWAYLSFSQFLLIWSENMPEESVWYLYRIRGGWQIVALALVVFQFAIPFCLLLSRDVKEQPRRLRFVATLVLGMQTVNLFWWVEAAYPGSMLLYWLLDLAAIGGIGGIWVWAFIWQLKRRSLLPLHDPYLLEYLPEFSAGEAAHG